ncbi:ankyrin repeat protein [Deerpox virus W-1170-84]|uniref:Ankyrin repeat protein n=1 Tax=Deerpox virus (strain W-1170-84) TaxID=305676 RepID=Q08F20_DPV84|nr:ankyrin repeat protein [Deerpox virus W-1170-84]
MFPLYDYIVFTKSKTIKYKNVLKLIESDTSVLHDYKSKYYILCEYLYKKYINIDVLNLLINTGIPVKTNNLINFCLSSFFANTKIKFNVNHVKEIIEILIKNGATFKRKPYSTHPLFYLICNKKFNYSSLYEYLTKYNINFNIKNPDGFNLLHMYLDKIDDVKLDVIKSLLSNKVKINAKTRFNRLTPLQIYLQKNFIQEKVVNFLIDNGSEINNGFIETPLYTLLNNCNSSKKLKSLTTKFIKKGADINQRAENDGRTPIVGFILNSAIINVDNLKFLLENGANPLVTIRGNNNLLHLYLERYNISISILSILLDSGIDINAFNYQNHRPIHVYLDKEAEDVYIIIIEFLLSKGAILARVNDSHRFSESILEVFLRNNKDITVSTLTLANYLLKLFPIDSIDEYGYNPLLSSVYTYNVEFFNYFIDLGADVNVVSKMGDTCSSIAITKEYKCIFSLLLKCTDISDDHIIQTIKYLEDKNFDTSVKIKMMEKYIRFMFNKNPDIYLKYKYLSLKFGDTVDECLKDLVHMKNTCLRKTTVFNLIFNKNNTMPIGYIFSDNVTQYLTSKVYGEKVKRVIENSLKRYSHINTILKRINNECGESNNIWNILPDEMKLKILDSLTLEDLLKLMILFKKRKTLLFL